MPAGLAAIPTILAKLRAGDEIRGVAISRSIGGLKE